MAERNDSHLLDGGDSVGMTDNQYKGMLLDQLEDWQEILDLAIAAGNTEIQKNLEDQRKAEILISTQREGLVETQALLFLYFSGV